MLLRDPIWQFVGAILTLIAIIATLAVYIGQRRKKSLMFEVLSKSPVLSAAEEIAGKLQILFQNQPVREVYLVVLRLFNAGNIPITSSDYERNISITFGGKARVLTAEVSETEPENLDAEISIKSLSSIELKPTLLNPGDSITIKILVSDFEGNIQVDGRIVGVKQIQERKESPRNRLFVLTFKFLMLYTVVALTYIFSELYHSIKMESLVRVALYGFVSVLYLFVLVRLLSKMRNPMLRSSRENH